MRAFSKYSPHRLYRSSLSQLPKQSHQHPCSRGVGRSGQLGPLTDNVGKLCASSREEPLRERSIKTSCDWIFSQFALLIAEQSTYFEGTFRTFRIRSDYSNLEVRIATILVEDWFNCQNGICISQEHHNPFREPLAIDNLV